MFGSSWDHHGPYARRWAHDPRRWDPPLRRRTRPRRPRYDIEGHADIGVILVLVALIVAVAWIVLGGGAL